MAIILFACTLLAGALAAPAISNEVDKNWEKESANNLESQRLYESVVSRERRSGYGNTYMSPCAAAAASAPIPAYAPSAAAATSLPSYASPSAVPYTYGHQSYQTVPAHKGHSYYSYGQYGHPYYRSEEEIDGDQEMLGFSDMNTFDHMPTARYSYGGAPVAQVGGGTNGGSQSAGPVVAVFSNANVGGYSIPILVRCSPSIIQGRMVNAHPYHDIGSSQGSLYRVGDEYPHHVEAERHQEKTSSELLSNDSKPTNVKHQ